MSVEHAKHASVASTMAASAQQQFPARPSPTFRCSSSSRGKPLGPPPTIPLPPRPDSSLPPTPTVTASPRSFVPNMTTDTDYSDNSGDELASIRRLSSCFPSPALHQSFGEPRSSVYAAGSRNDDSDDEIEAVLQLTDQRGSLSAAVPTTASSRLSDARRDLGNTVSVSPTSPTGFRPPTRSRPRRVSSKDSIMQQKIIGLVAALDLHADQMSSSSSTSIRRTHEKSPPPSTPDTPVSMPSLGSTSTLDISHSMQRTDSTGSFQVPAIRVAESGKPSFELDSIYDAYRFTSDSVMSNTFNAPAPRVDREDSDTEIDADSPRKRAKQNRPTVGLGFEDQRAVRRDSVVRTNRLGSAFSPTLQSTAEESAAQVRPGQQDPFAFYQFSPSLPPFVPSGLSPKDLTGTGTWSSIVARAASSTLLSRRPSVASVSSIGSVTGPVSLREIKATAEAKQQAAREEQRRRESLSAYVTAMSYRPIALHEHALANVRDVSPDTSAASLFSGGRSTSLSSYSMAAPSIADFGTRWPVAIGQDQVNTSPRSSVSGSRPESAQPKKYVEFCMQTSPTSSPATRSLSLPTEIGSDVRPALPELRRKSLRLSLLHVHGLDVDEPGAWPVRVRAPRLSSPNSASPGARHSTGLTRAHEEDENSGDESDESDLDVSVTLEVLAQRSGVWDDVRGAKRKIGVKDQADRHSFEIQRKIASIPQRTPRRSSIALVQDSKLPQCASPTRSISPELDLDCLEEDELSQVNLDEIDASHALLDNDEDVQLKVAASEHQPRSGGILSPQDTPNTTAGSDCWSSFNGDRSSTVSSTTTYSVNDSQKDAGSRRTSEVSDVATGKSGPVSPAPILRRKSSGLPILAVARSLQGSQSESNDSELLAVPTRPQPSPMLRRPQSAARLNSARSASNISSMLPSPTATATGISSSTTPSKLPSLRTVASTTSLRSHRALASPVTPPLSASAATADTGGTRSRLPRAPLSFTPIQTLSQHLAR